jgi:type VI secretion system protein ImpA
MATATLVISDLFDPISTDQPAGVDMRWTPEWDRIKEARRADDGLESGKWAKKESKAADWRLVRELTVSLLRERSKDLQLAMWLTEANLKLHGFEGLRDGLQLFRELIVRYWDQGLYPPMEDGPEDRAGPLEWLNDKLVDSITAVPITARGDGGPDYSLIELMEARSVGSESSWKTADGIIDEQKKRAYDTAIVEGRVSMDMFNGAIKETKRADYELFHALVGQTYDEFTGLEKVVDEKFGDVAPNLAACRSALREIKQEISDILDKIPAPKAVPQPGAEGSVQSGGRPGWVETGFPLSLSNTQVSAEALGGSWHEAEMLVYSGQVDRGLAEMTRLAAGETSGRNRFKRKLLLAEVCMASKRERLARSILEELAEQIDKFQLDFWETSDLIGSVWIKLYTMYKRGEGGPQDAERAGKLYGRLCRLDPWQALACGE